ncbi:Uncharacterized protein dnm_002700 [Desulfonema magnum]|uniref:Uncharacterized protein n=1 Tax=Desulfonema magnum TaxID=45655 RepID=A0A975BF80_9BACT|nr:Uncharacterized protein dnm_002700 [Desulfonema magnum]
MFLRHLFPLFLFALEGRKTAVCHNTMFKLQSFYTYLTPDT